MAMTHILLVDDDLRLLRALSIEIHRLGYQCYTAASADRALDILRSEPIDVLLTDLRMPGADGIELLRASRSVTPDVRMLLMSAYATARDYKTARRLGALDVLMKPFTPIELADALRRAESFDSGFRGELHGFTLIDVLQMLHYARRTLLLRVGNHADIHLIDGEIIHAQDRTSAGADALKRLLSMESGAISTKPPVECERTITMPFQNLLLHTLAEIDEGIPQQGELANIAFSPPPTRPAGRLLGAVAPSISVSVTSPADPYVIKRRSVWPVVGLLVLVIIATFFITRESSKAQVDKRSESTVLVPTPLITAQ